MDGSAPTIPEESVRGNHFYARTIPANVLKVIKMECPHSNFDLVDNEFGGLPPLRRIMSQVRKQKGRTMVWEEIQDSEDLKQENEDIRIRLRCPDFKSAKTVRLSFFKKNFKSKKGLENTTEKDFLGYAIVRNISIPCCETNTWLYESVIGTIKKSRDTDNYVRGEQEWICSIGGHNLRIKGYLYAQQNTFTNVCAHVALRTAVRRFTQNDMTYREMNNLIGIDHVKRKLGAGFGGLSTPEMIKVLESAGARCMVVNYTTPGGDKDKIPFQKILYGSIESGFPAIVIFQTADEPDVCHAIPIFGHSFIEDTWVHRAESAYFQVGRKIYIPSESWVSMYIAHDDNWGSNFCVPRGYLHTRRYCDWVASDAKSCLMDSGCVAYVIGTRPREVEMDPIQAEVIGADYLFNILPKSPNLEHAWMRRVLEYLRVNQLVLRPILIKGKDYLEHLKKIRDWDKNKLTFSLPMDDSWWLWMVELSVPELFSTNRRKIGEVILRAEQKPTRLRDFKNFLFARIPEFFAFYVKGGAQNPSYIFIPSDLKSHVELYGCEENA